MRLHAPLNQLCFVHLYLEKEKWNKNFFSFKEIINDLPLVQITKCLVDLCRKLRSNSCWVLVGDAPAIKRAVASYKNTLAVANYKF